MALLLLAFLLLATLDISEAAMTDTERAALGERIYREGILSDGSPLSRVVSPSTPNADVACVRCHRRSGLGGMEGGQLVPAVTGDYLFRNHLKVVTEPTLRRIRRWAYNEAAFDRALRQGIDVMGDPISVVMPRYALPEQDRQSLMAYLKTLVHDDKPGIDDDTIHIATVVDSRLPADQRAALIEVAKRYVETDNRVIQAREKRAAFSNRQNNWNFQSFRRWQWHLWELEGEPSSWPQQLADHYRRQPVFILVGGAVAGAWDPIDRFCEQQGLPTVFPHTDLPPTGERSHFTFYLSRGLQLEADVLASYLRLQKPGVERLHQLHSDDETGRYAAQALTEALADRGIAVESHTFDTASSPDREALAWMDRVAGNDAVMLWLDGDRLAAWQAAMGEPPEQGRLFVSSSLLGEELNAVDGRWAARLELIHPFSLPWENSAGLSQGFLDKWGIRDPANFRLQSETFVAFATVSQVIKRVRQNLVREYFMEQLEHMSEGLRATSVYPRFSLGPYQRVVSKGAYVLPLSALGEGNTGQNPRWLIPGI